MCWTGYLAPEEVSASFLAADLCVLPFRDGVSFLHGTFHAALAHGVPILTTRPRVRCQSWPTERMCTWCRLEDPEALARAIVELAGAPELRRRLGEGAGALSEQFRWPAIAADTLRLYRATGAVGIFCCAPASWLRRARPIRAPRTRCGRGPVFCLLDQVGDAPLFRRIVPLVLQRRPGGQLSRLFLTLGSPACAFPWVRGRRRCGWLVRQCTQQGSQLSQQNP